MRIWILAISSVSVVSLLSLVGLTTLSMREAALRRALLFMVGLAVGALLGDAFVHLIPQSFATLGFGPRVPALTMAGMGGFFLLEKFLHWHHESESAKRIGDERHHARQCDERLALLGFSAMYREGFEIVLFLLILTGVLLAGVLLVMVGESV